jgi:hypothetical protein
MSDDRQVVKQLDHVIARVDDPQPLFKLLSETLQLPIAWPLRSYPSFTSGGIALGNLYLEVLSCASQQDASSNNSPAARFVAIAFESGSLGESVGELDRLKLPHGPVVPYVEIDSSGKKTKLYANVILGKMLGGNYWIDSMIFMARLPGSSAMANPGAGGALVRWGLSKVMNGQLVFLVEYAYGEFTNLPHWSEFGNHEEKRAADKTALASVQGGVLGIESVKEIVAGVKDFEETQKRWSKLLGSNAETAPGLWKIADGPVVHLVSATGNGIQSLVLKVSSLKKAETFLSENGMLGAPLEGLMTIAPEKIFGLDVSLAE